MIELLVLALFVLFVFTQAVYFLVNLAVVALLYVRRVNLVPEERPTRERPIHVLMAVRTERREIVERTIERIYEQAYPDELIHVYLIYEEEDAGVAEYVDDLGREATERGWSVTPWSVDRNGLQYYLEAEGGLFETGDLPRTKAAALTYAFSTLSLPEGDVVTVYDADTELPSDVFALGVRGLEEYDIVQAKQTVRNHADGWLPTLEAMGIAAWSHVIYAHTSKGPYQLLGKGYFVGVKELYALGSWDADEITEDMALGVEAYANGYTLGVIDRYVQDLCPAEFDTWARQKRRWVRGPYKHLLTPRLSFRDRLRFLTFTVANQMLTLTNLVGIPAGIFVLWQTLSGTALEFPTALSVLVTANLVSWIYYTVRTYAATRRAVIFENGREKVRFYLLSNPFTQLLYATIWAVPIVGALRQSLDGSPSEFEITPK